MIRKWSLFALIVALLTPSLALQCWTNVCANGQDWCAQQCNEQEACYGSYISDENSLIPSPNAGFYCLRVPENDCLNTRCELSTSSSVSNLHDCCCKSDFCNALEDLIEAVSPPTQGTIATPSGPVPSPSEGMIVCESYQPTEHIYKECLQCSARYKSRNGLYELEIKDCLTVPAASPCHEQCVLDTSSGVDQISCCCNRTLCNTYPELMFTDVTQVSDYVHLSPCDNTTCTHSCVLIDQQPVCKCREGFFLHSDGQTCLDINECLSSPCEYQCENKEGSYRCVCPSGMRLIDGHCEDDGLVCVSLNHTLDVRRVLYCDDHFSQYPDSDHTEVCQGVYELRPDNTFVPFFLKCFAHTEENVNACKDECFLSPLGSSPIENSELYQCCCTTDFCNGRPIFPNATSEPNDTTTVTGAVTTTEPSVGPLNTGSVAGLAVAILLVAVLGLSVAVTFCCLCKYWGCNKVPSQHLEEEIIDGPASFSYSTSDNIALLEEIGRGRFSVVYRGTRNSSTVAVKCFEMKESFHKEVSIYLTEGLSHENILKYLASVESSEEKRYWIVFQYHCRGSLYSLLVNNTVTHKEFCTLAESAAAGLSFLHREETARGKITKPCIVHRDLKSKNILIKSSGQCAISDFGLSIRFPLADDQEGHGQVGTSRYMAPEVLEGSIFFDRASYKAIDCYALGVIYYEILTRTEASGEPVPPYSPPFSERVPQQPNIEDMREIVSKNHYRPPIPDRFIKDEMFDKIVETILELWDSVPNGRLKALTAYDRMKAYRLETFEEKTMDSGLDVEIPSTPTSHTSMSSIKGHAGFSASNYTSASNCTTETVV